MDFKQHKSWIAGVFAVSVLSLVSTYSVIAQPQEKLVAIEFSDLSNAEIDWIISVKDEMRLAQLNN